MVVITAAFLAVINRDDDEAKDKPSCDARNTGADRKCVTSNRKYQTSSSNHEFKMDMDKVQDHDKQ